MDLSAAIETARRWGAKLCLIGALSVTALGLSACAISDESRAYRDYSAFMAQTGRFRQERAPLDAPYTKDDLVRNFEKVAFVPERQLAAFYAKRTGERRLSKWPKGFTYAVVGDGVRSSDREEVERIMAILRSRSGLDIRPDYQRPLMTIFVLSAEARRQVGEAEGAKAWYHGSLFRDWVETLNPPCFALFDASTPDGGAIRSGAVFVKAEIEEPLRGACLVEELTQSMGLIFDHDDVRPSIFNDDQEFIALTQHDEDLLEILYDPRLKAGMTRAQAGPIVRRIVKEKKRLGASTPAAKQRSADASAAQRRG